MKAGTASTSRARRFGQALKREVEIVIKGQTQKLTLKPNLPGSPRFGPVGPRRGSATGFATATAGCAGIVPGSLPESRPIDLNVFRLYDVLRNLACCAFLPTLPASASPAWTPPPKR